MDNQKLTINLNNEKPFYSVLRKSRRTKQYVKVDYEFDGLQMNCYFHSMDFILTFNKKTNLKHVATYFIYIKNKEVTNQKHDRYLDGIKISINMVKFHEFLYEHFLPQKALIKNHTALRNFIHRYIDMNLL